MQSQRQVEFENLLLRNNAIICKICWMYCDGCGFYFDELRQECAAALWKEFCRHNRFRQDSSESTWVYQIVSHAAISYMRSRKHKQLPPIDKEHEWNLLANAADPDGTLLFNELIGQLDVCEKKMMSYYLDNRSYNDIAQQECITEDNARQRMSRLLKKLKRLLCQ